MTAIQTGRVRRHRPSNQITMSPEAWAIADQTVADGVAKNRSKAIERAVMEALPPLLVRCSTDDEQQEATA